MGLSISLLSLTWIEVIRKNIVGLETIALFKSSGINPENAASNDSSKEIQKIALGCKSLEIEKNPKLEDENPMTELHEAAVKLQKVYKSYRTRRNLADCAVVVEELWWKALDFASLRRSSISFFHDEKPETAVSRWARARTMAAKVGKGLSKSDKAKKLALQHWLEAIDPRHRYGHNLHFYYDVWFKSESAQPFFYWLDIGDGREVNLHKIYSFSSPIFALKLVQLSRYPSCNQSARVQKPAWFFLLLIIIFFPSEIMECASLASPRQPLTQVQAQAHANMEKEVFEEEMKMRVGSRPTNCENKCGGCEPCMAIQVPTSVDRMRPLYANYEPEGWKCKCGSTFYNP